MSSDQDNLKDEAQDMPDIREQEGAIVKKDGSTFLNVSSPKAAIEALLFVSEKPLLIDQIKGVLEDLDPAKIRDILLEIKADYENSERGLRVDEIAGGFQMATAPEVGGVLKKFYKQRDSQRLSKPALETLAIIAYKQPVTRLDIESFRGVNVDGVVRSLLEKGLIRITGKKDIIGRPFVYGTTRQFLEYFGLRSLEDLPKIEDFINIANTPVTLPLNISNRQHLQVQPENSLVSSNDDTKAKEDAPVNDPTREVL